MNRKLTILRANSLFRIFVFCRFPPPARYPAKPSPDGNPCTKRRSGLTPRAVRDLRGGAGGTPRVFPRSRIAHAAGTHRMCRGRSHRRRVNREIPRGTTCFGNTGQLVAYYRKTRGTARLQSVRSSRAHVSRLSHLRSPRG